ncbi:MAG: transposase [Methanocalculus sp. MSAO_Arc2]|nr:MAG: transposase [Methanocalculus sp. MSAO_Arc2]
MKTHNKWKTALDYVVGLVTAPSQRTLTLIATHCSSMNNQAFSHFPAQSPWDHRKLTDWIMDQGWRTIGNNGALVIDECGNPKAGKHSVAVSRQYCGNIGKLENSQVGVFMAYVKGDRRLLLNYRLYIPAYWIDDPDRCDAAGIPKEHQVFKTKSELVSMAV